MRDCIGPGIWKPQKVYNDGIYLVYSIYPTYDDIQYKPGIYLVYTCHMTMYVI